MGVAAVDDGRVETPEAMGPSRRNDADSTDEQMGEFVRTVVNARSQSPDGPTAELPAGSGGGAK